MAHQWLQQNALPISEFPIVLGAICLQLKADDSYYTDVVSLAEANGKGLN